MVALLTAAGPSWSSGSRLRATSPTCRAARRPSRRARRWLSMAAKIEEITGNEYKYGFHHSGDAYVFKSQRGLSEEVVRQLSAMKGEPEWMLRFRLRALQLFYRKPLPTWGADLSGVDFDNMFYYV